MHLTADAVGVDLFEYFEALTVDGLWGLHAVSPGAVARLDLALVFGFALGSGYVFAFNGADQ